MGSVQRAIGLAGKDMMEDLAAAVQARRWPRVLAGDWNSGPRVLHEWARRAGGRIFSGRERAMGE